MMEGENFYLFIFFLVDAMEWVLLCKMWSPRITVDIFCPSCLLSFTKLNVIVQLLSSPSGKTTCSCFIDKLLSKKEVRTTFWPHIDNKDAFILGENNFRK